MKSYVLVACSIFSMYALFSISISISHIIYCIILCVKSLTEAKCSDMKATVYMGHIAPIFPPLAKMRHSDRSITVHASEGAEKGSKC